MLARSLHSVSRLESPAPNTSTASCSILRCRLSSCSGRISRRTRRVSSTVSVEDAPQYLWAGKKVSIWRTVGTSVNSLNYFTDGTLSNQYFVIEGYSKENSL
jgi:hypothetical protein